MPSHHPDSRGSSWKQIKKGRGRGEQNRLLEADPAFWLFEPNTVTTQSGVGDGKLQIAQMASSSFFLFLWSRVCRNRAAGSKANIYCLLTVCKMNADTLSCIWGCLSMSRARKEGVHHDIKSLAEQGGTSKGTATLLQKDIHCPHNCLDTLRAADEGTARPVLRGLLLLCLIREKEEAPSDWIC